MKSSWKRILSLALVAVFMLSSVPAMSLIGFADWFTGLSFMAHAEDIPVHSVGDIVSFGSYPQSAVADAEVLEALAQAEPDTNGDAIVDGAKYRLYSGTWYAYEPVQWKVLSEEEGEYFLFAVNLLDCLPYHTVSTDMTWENCSLREWLNSDFFNECFTEQEKKCVLPTAILNGAVKPWMGVSADGGRNTEDNVYLLSYDEVSNKEYGFSANGDRKASPSDYSVARGVTASESSGQIVGKWWLRTTGNNQTSAAFCANTGGLYSLLSINKNSQVVTNAETGVRPAIHITYTPIDPDDETIKSGKCGDTARWILDTETGLLTIRGVGEMYNYNDADESPWEGFSNQIQTVLIRSGITSIGSYASVGWYYAKELTIPDTISKIEYKAFDGSMGSLQTLNYNAANCAAVTDDRGEVIPMFSEFSSVANYLSLSAINIGDSVKTIPAYAFAGIGFHLTSLNIGNGVTDIGAYAFMDVQATSIVLPNTVKTIDEGAFQYSAASNITLSNALTTIGKKVFCANRNLKTIAIPNTVTSIGENAFESCRALQTVQYNAANCIVAENAFKGCGKITELVIGSSVTSVPPEIFIPCTENTTITLNESNSSFYTDESGVLYSKNGKTLIKNTDWSLTEYTLPDTVTSINAYAFYGMDELTSLTVSPHVATIGVNAFPKTGSLTVYGYPETAAYTYCVNNQINFESLEPDTTAPSVDRLYVTPSAPTATRFSASINVSDDLGLKKLIAEYSLDNGETYTSFYEKDYNSWELSASASCALDVSGLPSGKVVIRAVALDRYNNRTEAYVNRTIDHTAPLPPENVTVTETPSYIQVMWTKDPVEDDFNVFRVYRSTSPDSGFSRVKQLSTIGYYDDLETGALAGTTYYYYITSVDTLGNESEPSEIKSGKLMEDDILPKVVSYTPASGTKSYNKSMTITVSAWDNYKLGKISLDYRLKGTESWTHLTDITVSTKNAVQSYNWNMTSLAAGEYEVRMTATDSVDNLSEETIATYTIVEYQAPVAPTLTTENGHRYVQLRWSYSGLQNLVSSYAVYRKPAGSDSYTHVVTTGKNAYADAVAVGDYVYKVVVKDSYGATATSAEVAGSSLILDEVAPTAYIYMKNPIIIPGRSLVFNGSYSYDNDVIASYLWDFGDGVTAAQATATHSYDEPGSYTATLTVTDAAGNTGSATIALDVVDVSEESGKQLVNVTVRDSAGGTISGANVIVSDGENSDSEIVAQTNAGGVAELVLDRNMVYDMYTYKENSDYSPNQSRLDLTKKETPASSPANAPKQIRRAKGNSDSSDLDIFNEEVILRSKYFTGTLTTRELTPDEIEEAKIDTTKPENQHVYTYTASFTYEYEEPDDDDPGNHEKKLELTYYTDSKGTILGTGGSGGWWSIGSVGWGGSGAVPGYASNGWLQIDQDTYIKPLGGKGNNDNDKDDKKQYFLKLNGKVGWLKQMFRVDLIILNSSKDDWMEDCVAKLDLPDGISLAGMEDCTQSLTKRIGTINKNGQASASWYVRGDKAGSYDLSVEVTGTIYPEPCEEYDRIFVTDEPLEIQDASNAIALDIEAPQSVENGMSYGIKFTLTNTTMKDLYFVTLKVKDEEFGPVTLEAMDSVTFVHSEKFDFSSEDPGTIMAYLKEGTIVCGQVQMKGSGYEHDENGLCVNVYVFRDSFCEEEASDLLYTAGSYAWQEDDGTIGDCDDLYVRGTVTSKKAETIYNVTVTIQAPEGFSFKPMEMVSKKEIVLDEVTVEGEVFSAPIYPIYSNRFESAKKVQAEAKAKSGENGRETYIIAINKNEDEGTIYFRPSGAAVTNYRDDESPTTKVTWDVSCFSRTALGVNVDPTLAKLQAALSSAAYREKDIKDSLKNIGFSHLSTYNYVPGENPAFQKVINGGDDYVGHTFAKKKIIVNENGKNKVYALIAVVVRGTVYTEWYGNANVGEGDVHKGFNIAKENIAEHLQAYMQKNGETVEQSKMMITGHSRGAAAANLLAGDLCTSQMYADRANTYAYSFATPRGTKNPVGYTCIKNILFDEDVVTAVAMESWGFERNGYDLYFKPEKHWIDAGRQFKNEYTSGHDVERWNIFDTILPDVVDGLAAAFSDASPYSWKENRGYETIPLKERGDAVRDALFYVLHESRISQSNIISLYLGAKKAKIIKGLVKIFGENQKENIKGLLNSKNKSKFDSIWQSSNLFGACCEIILPVISNNKDESYKALGEMTLYEFALLSMRWLIVEETNVQTQQVLNTMTRNICRLNGWDYPESNENPEKQEDNPITNRIWYSHCMENYMSYVDVSGTDYRTHRRHENGEQDIVKEARISCPVDVEVYDAQNNLVGRIVQNVVDNSVDGMVDLSVEGDTKVVRMYADQNHYIKIIGNDDGTMNYTVSEYDETGTKTRQVNFFDIPVENGKTISGMVNDELNTPIENYYLTMPSGSTVTENENLTDDAIDSLDIRTASVGHGFAFGDGLFTSGDKVTLYAFPNEGEEFLGWYVGETLVSEESTYSFIVRASGEYTAKFTTLVEKDPDDRISATITDQITVNFLLDLDVRENPQVITVRHLSPVGEELETLTFEADKLTRDSKTGLYRLSIPVAPAQGADRYELSIDGTPIVQDIYSVKDYCNYFIANGSSPAYSMYVNLAKAMLEYCEAANEYFDYTAEFAGTEDAQKAITDVAGLENHMSINANGKIQSISYMAVTKPEFRFYVNSDSGLTETDFVALNDKITVTGGNGKVTVKFVKNAETGAILLEVTGIEAATMNEIITIMIVGFGAITFCGNDFARLLAKNDSTATLGAALYLYGVNAKACFSSTGA